jgi:hypothetical protein
MGFFSKIFGSSKKHKAKQHAPGSKIGEKKDKGKGTEAFKLDQGKKYSRLQRFETLSPDQKKLLKNWFKETKGGKYGAKFLEKAVKEGPPVSKIEKSGSNFLQNLLGQSAEDRYKDFEAPYLRQFREQVVPEIAERFTGPNAQRSSAFQQALGGAGAGLTENLAALKGNLISQMLNQQLQGANIGLGYSQLPMQRYGQQMGAAEFMLNQQFQQQQHAMGTQPWGMLSVPPRGKAPSFWQSMAPGMGAGLGAGIGSMIMPGIGTAIGSMIGGGIGGSIGGGGVRSVTDAPVSNLR